MGGGVVLGKILGGNATGGPVIPELPKDEELGIDGREKYSFCAGPW